MKLYVLTVLLICAPITYAKKCNSKIKKRAIKRCNEFGAYLKRCSNIEFEEETTKQVYVVRCKNPTFVKHITFRMDEAYSVQSITR